jgi:hypothetical protein
MGLRIAFGALGCLLFGALGQSLFFVVPSNAQTVTLDVQGTLEASCALTGLPGGTVDLGDLSRAGSKPISFSVDCNAPFGYALVSGKGALGRVGSAGAIAAGSNAFGVSVPYVVTTTFATDQGTFGDTALAASTLTSIHAEPCLAPTFSTSCPFSHSGSGAAASGRPASLLVAWSSPSIQLQAGTYTDTLTLTVRART